MLPIIDDGWSRPGSNGQREKVNCGEQRTLHFWQPSTIPSPQRNGAGGDNGNTVIGIWACRRRGSRSSRQCLSCRNVITYPSKGFSPSMLPASLADLTRCIFKQPSVRSLTFMREDAMLRAYLERSFADGGKTRRCARSESAAPGPLNMFHLRTATVSTALQCAKRCSADGRYHAGSGRDCAGAPAILGISLHLVATLQTPAPSS